MEYVLAGAVVVLCMVVVFFTAVLLVGAMGDVK